jgi:hypothetical protein
MSDGIYNARMGVVLGGQSDADRTPDTAEMGGAHRVNNYSTSVSPPCMHTDGLRRGTLQLRPLGEL